MTRPLLTRIEEGYLKLFRIAIIVVLTLVLVATVAIGVQGALKTMARPKAIEPAKTAPAPSVSVEEFLKEFDKQPEASGCLSNSLRNSSTDTEGAGAVFAGSIAFGRAMVLSAPCTPIATVATRTSVRTTMIAMRKSLR